MAPASPQPVAADVEDIGPGDVGNYGLALDGDQQAEFEIEEEQVCMQRRARPLKTRWDSRDAPQFGPN